MSSILGSDLFPTKLSIFIFLCYMSLFISQGLLVTASQENNNKYKYNTVTVVLLTEILKLIVSSLLYCRTHRFSDLVRDVVKDSKILLLYFVPAFLYCLYNNLAFINLSTFDPTTYFLLLQFRVVITGILFQIIFKTKLSKKQWLSLILLTFGCMVKQINFSDSKSMESSMANGKNTSGLNFSFSAVLILVQTVCSCLAGVYNEYLLKSKGSDVNIYIQNVFMYLDSIVCNVLILSIQGDLLDAFEYTSLQSVFQWNVITIIINNAAIGIVTSFFLKHMNSILKTFASAIELMFTAVLSYFFFSIPIYLNTILSIGIVSYSIFLYSQNPVINLGNIKSKTSKIENAHIDDSTVVLLKSENSDEIDEV